MPSKPSAKLERRSTEEPSMLISVSQESREEETPEVSSEAETEEVIDSLSRGPPSQETILSKERLLIFNK
jgi:hypothetical protein